MKKDFLKSAGLFGLLSALLFILSVIIPGCFAVLDAEAQTVPNRANVTTTTNGVLTGSSTNFFSTNTASGTNIIRTVDGNGKAIWSLIPNPTNLFSAAFQSGVTPAHVEGLLWYDSTDKSLTYYNDEPDVAMNLGREMWARVRNSSGATIMDGTAVYINGATGQLPTVELAQANAETTSQLIGVATHAIENNSNGYVTIIGEVKNLNTSGFNDGDVLYLSTTTPGAFTTTKPTAPNLAVRIGIVEHAHVTQGKILVHPDIQSIPASGIYDSTSAGRTLLTAADAAAQRTALGLGTMALESTNNWVRGVAAGSNVTTSTNNGVVTVNATGGGEGTGPSLVGYKVVTITNQYSQNTTMAIGNTNFMTSQGTPIITNTYTPVSTTNILEISLDAFHAASVANSLIGAIFEGANTTSVAASHLGTTSAGNFVTKLSWTATINPASSGSPVEYVFYAGRSGGSATWYINRSGTDTSTYGGQSVIKMIVKEFKP